MTTLGRQQRADQHAIRARALLSLHRLWPALDLRRVPETYPAWARAVGTVVQTGRDESADSAAAYMLDVWDEADLEHGEVVRPGPVVGERLAISLFVTSVIAYRTALGNGQNDASAEASAYAGSAGAVGRYVLEAGRDTVVETAKKDERIGWERQTDGSACDFCQMLADRGAAYLAEDTASFESHDHCGCTAEAIVKGDGS